jgi:hypothetical protein
VKVIDKHSGQLIVGRDLPCHAQVLISEIFSSDLLGEGILPAIEHARRELLTGDAVILPRRATAKAYIAGGPAVEALLFAGRTNGFDLSPFNDFAPPIYAATLGRIDHRVLSDDFELFAFDLGSDSFPMDSRKIAVPITRSGVASVLAQWIDLDLDGISRYENRPSKDPQADNHWTQILYRFPQPVSVEAGAVLPLAIGHNRRQFWVAPAQQ